MWTRLTWVAVGATCALWAGAGCGDDDGDDDDTPTIDATVAPDAPDQPDGGDTPDAAGPDAGDETAPAAPTGFTATLQGDGSVQLDWTNPGDADLAGILLVRRRVSAVAGPPVDGTGYTAGGTLGAGETILLAATATSFTDTDVAPPGRTHYAVYAFDGVFNYSAPAAASVNQTAASAQSGTLSVANLAATPAVTVTQQPPQHLLAGTASYDGGTQTLTVNVSVTSGYARNLFNPKLVTTGVNQGALSGADGSLAGDPFERLANGLHPGETRSIDLVFTGVDGSVDPIVIDLTVADHPMLIVGNHYDSPGMYQLVDTGSASWVGFVPCDALVYAGVPGANANSYCAARPGALDADATRLYLGHKSLPVVRVVDPVDHAPVASLMLSTGVGSVDSLQLDATGENLYVLVNLGSHAFGQITAANGGGAFSATKGADLVRVNPTTLTETGRVTLMAGETNIQARGRRFGLSNDGTRAVIVEQWTGRVHFVDLTTMTEIDTDPGTAGTQPIDISATAIAPHQAIWSQDDARVFVQPRGTAASLVVIDTTTFVVTTIAAGGASTTNTGGMLLDGARLWVANQSGAAGGSALVVFLLDQLDMRANLTPTGGSPHALARSADGTRMYVALKPNAAPFGVRLYDSTTLTQVDADGDAGNGVSDIVLGLQPGSHLLLSTPF